MIASHASAEKASFIAMWLGDWAEGDAFAVQTRSQARKAESGLPTSSKDSAKAANSASENTKKEGQTGEPVEKPYPEDTPLPLEYPKAADSARNSEAIDAWKYPAGIVPDLLDEAQNPNATQLLVELDTAFATKLQEGYAKDPSLRHFYVEEIPNADTALTPSRYVKGTRGLLYFVDADWRYRLCVPHTMVQEVLEIMHKKANEAAHAGPARFYARMRDLFFWKGMWDDVQAFARSCDICQKTKVDHHGPQGGLRPAHIPLRPFETVSLDLITGLPVSGVESFDAVLVIVDKLTKYALFVPTHGTLDSPEFARLFMSKVVHVYGLPSRLIADRDPRWTSQFWREVFEHYKGILAVSSAHHPQTDGQTEIVNAQLEQMLRAYVGKDRKAWSRFLSELAYAYNSTVHSTTNQRPDRMLMGYEPQIWATGFVPPSGNIKRTVRGENADGFIQELEAYRSAARDAIAHAQELQTQAYNKGRRPVRELKVGDLALINPHTLELVDIKGTGKKLVQKYLGPFEVMERINPVVYRLRLPAEYPMHPIFNIEHLRRYEPLPAQFPNRTTMPDLRIGKESSKEYEVEAILGHKDVKRGGKVVRHYQVRWKGYDANEDKWVSEYQLRNAPVLRREYLSQFEQETQNRRK